MEHDEENIIIDLDEVFAFVFTKEDRDVNTTIEEVYGTDNYQEQVLLNKKKSENKSSDHSQHEAIRYEFIKRLLDTFDEVNVDEETNEPEFYTLSQELAWNTLFRYGFLKKI